MNEKARTTSSGVVSFLEEFAGEAGLPGDVFQQIIADDDWVAVIKASAVIETTLNEALAPALPAEWREWFVRRVTVATKRELALKRGRLDPFTAKAVDALATLRNNVVHDAGGFSFTFANYLQGPKGEALVQAFAPLWIAYAERPTRKPSEAERNLVTSNPKAACMMVALMAALELMGRLPAKTITLIEP